MDVHSDISGSSFDILLRITLELLLLSDVDDCINWVVVEDDGRGTRTMLWCDVCQKILCKFLHDAKDAVVLLWLLLLNARHPIDDDEYSTVAESAVVLSRKKRVIVESLGDVSVKCESESCEVMHELFCGAPMIYLPKLHRPIYLQRPAPATRQWRNILPGCRPAYPPHAMVQ